MKPGLYILFILFSFYGYTQTNLQGLIKDSKSKEPVPYCAIAVKNSSRGCLSNDEGLFQISAKTEDTLLISYIGYKRKLIAVSEFVKSPLIYIERKEAALSEVVIYSNDDYLYEAFENCREKLLHSKEKESKTYFVLETELARQPVELLECYYNGFWNNAAVKNIVFKNGRVGIATYNERFFMSQNISKAFTFLDLTQVVDHLPVIPLQCTKKKLKKYFQLKLKSVYENDNPVYEIQFTPVDTNGRYFSGEAWIEKNSGALKKITLEINNTTDHPFLPLSKDFGEIKNASMQITKTYANINGENLLSHIDFNYQLKYHHIHSSIFLNSNRDTSFEINSKGLMYFYDYGKPFITPYFTYDQELSDYRKINSLTYNESFWTSNNGLVYSEKMKKGINYFKANGQLINYKTRSFNKDHFLAKGAWGLENSYIEWSDKRRISLKRNNIKNDTVSYNDNRFLTQRYHLKAQLFLDLNPMGDSIQHYSASIFDVYETFYHIPEEPFTNCFFNIYFDLFEIERRKMEKIISQHIFTVVQFDSLYKQCCKNLDEQTSDYLEKVERGKNLKALEKWNYYVKQNIGIDNFEIFQLQNVKK
jgi:hypothetical protein